MSTTVEIIIAMVMGLILFGIIFWLFIQNLRNNQKIINFTARTLFPMLSIALVGYSFLRPSSSTDCNASFQMVFYIGLALTILLIVIGLIRFLISPARDTRALTVPVLLAALAAIVLVALNFVFGCSPI